MTLALVAVVVLTTTSLGCGPVKAMHLKPSASCQPLASTSDALVTSPLGSPFATARPNPRQDSPEPAPNPGPTPNPEVPSYVHNGGEVQGGITYFGPASAGGPVGSGLNCRLPVFGGGSGSGGFVVFPSGSFQPDPASAVTVPSPSPSASSTQYSQGWWGLTYDRAYSRWLPVPQAWVSPDGKQYAYPGSPDGIYVQNLASGTQVELGEGTPWSLLDVEANGVYAVKGQTGGLWLLSFTGAVTTITTSGFWQAVGGGAAYGTITSSVPSGAGNTILRLDLNTGSTTNYFAMPRFVSSVAGVGVNGKPVVFVQGPIGLEIWTETAAGMTGIALINSSNFYPNQPPIGDGHGLWLAANKGIALYVYGQGWSWMSDIGGQLAGGCR
jgi:hypothetical protein